jgi:hypothetical protein
MFDQGRCPSSPVIVLALTLNQSLDDSRMHLTPIYVGQSSEQPHDRARAIHQKDHEFVSSSEESWDHPMPTAARILIHTRTTQ